MSSRVTTQLLGYSGLLPFFGFCVGFSLMEDWPRSLSIQGFVIYSLAIFAFLAGALWGQEQRLESASSVSTPVTGPKASIWLVARSCRLCANTGEDRQMRARQYRVKSSIRAWRSLERHLRGITLPAGNHFQCGLKRDVPGHPIMTRSSVALAARAFADL